MVVQSILSRVRNKFGVSAGETDAQDVLQTIVIGIACVAGTTALPTVSSTMSWILLTGLPRRKSRKSTEKSGK